MSNVATTPPVTPVLRLIDRVVRRVPWTPGTADVTPLVEREWLVTNGLGGYSSASVAGMVTRRYHGLLVAALPNPIGRLVMLNYLVEHLTLADGTQASLGGSEWAEGRLLEAEGTKYLTEFRLEAGLPVWTFAIGSGPSAVRIERRVVMPYRQNTVFISYKMLEGAEPARLELRPALQFRGYEQDVTTSPDDRYTLSAEQDHYVVRSVERPELPPLRLSVVGADDVTVMFDPMRTQELLYRVEESRGYADRGALWSPGHFALTLRPNTQVTLVASTESSEVLHALTPDDACASERERRRRLLDMPAAPVKQLMLDDARAAELVLAADQFLITPAGRLRDRVRAQAVGDEVRTVIAGYHWFTDWGRDTMISLEGLTLTTGRIREAGFILRTFAQYVRDGLIPNMFPDGSNEGLYHTADATLWFFHAVDRYVRLTDDRATIRQLLPVLQDIADRHIAGTRFGIHVDPTDGLLVQGAEGYQLTWMDANYKGWLPTPRRGKAVEINALWYNALTILAGYLTDERGADAAQPYASAAARARTSFNTRFWYEAGGYLYDVVDGADGDSHEFRPNQLVAISLPNAVCDESRWASVVAQCEQKLVTPVGLRSLAPGEPAYRPVYVGDLESRDGAYHQGTVWGWLIGPWFDAWRRVHPNDLDGAERWLEGLLVHLDYFGVGSIAEIFDAEAPFTPRGCIAQAWSVAETLRCYAEIAAARPTTRAATV